jgi:hypothetical protein
MNYDGERMGDGQLATEFFLDFPVKGRDGRFSGFDFSTGKLPLECEVLAGRALGDEHAAIVFDYDTADRDGITTFHGPDLNGGYLAGARREVERSDAKRNRSQLAW